RESTRSHARRQSQPLKGYPGEEEGEPQDSYAYVVPYCSLDSRVSRWVRCLSSHISPLISSGNLLGTLAEKDKREKPSNSEGHNFGTAEWQARKGRTPCAPPAIVSGRSGLGN